MIQTTRRDDFNAIDPSVLLARDGKLWLALGSYWSGIKVVELDPGTGKRPTSGGVVIPVAWHQSIEAACLHQRGEFYYLIVNWGQCCHGTNSTYNLRVGRSRSASGPYLDRQGVDLLRGGGTLLLASEGRFIGPGHAGFLRTGGGEWLSFHYYDGERAGAKTLGLQPLSWTADGWPEVRRQGGENAHQGVAKPK